MNPHYSATALIAEDEPLLAQALAAELALVWPGLRVLATVGDGVSAVVQALSLQPDVLFFDIQMPGQDGLSAAAELVDRWPTASGKPFPALVFVTAFDAYAVQAFEAQAIDYLLKPVQAARLQKTVSKVQLAQAFNASSAINSEVSMARTLAQLQGLIHASLAANAQGHRTRMVPVDDVLHFEAADKYIRVFTADADHLIRTPLKELLQQLDAAVFWPIHRGTVVRASAVHTCLNPCDAGWRPRHGHCKPNLR